MKKQWLLIPLATTTCVAPLSATVSCSQQQSGFDILLSSYKQMLEETVNLNDYDGKTADQIKSELAKEVDTKMFGEPCETYLFRNINYEDGDRAIWPAHQHIVRTLQIAMIADRDNNDELMDIAKKLTCYWLCHKYENSNWWFNEIGVPRDLSNLAIFLKHKLTRPQQDKLMEWIHHGSLKYNEATTKYTGTNTFWACDITMKSACLVQDKDEMQIMLDYLYKEIKVDAPEGFQSDGTYFQHNQLLYTGGYGRQGALMIAKIASAFDKTDEYTLDDKKLKIVVDFALDGMRYMTHKGNFTWQCMGRTWTRKRASDYAGGVTDLGNITEMKYLANLPNCPRKRELKELIAKWENKDSNFNGIKFFPKSQFIAWNYDGIYIGLRGTTKDLNNFEMGNGENLLGHNMSYGFTNCVMETGNEYVDISPIWNYQDIPGTTTIDETDDELHYYENGIDVAPKKKETIAYGDFNEDENVAFISQQSYQKFRSNDSLEDPQYKGQVNYTITAFACEDGVAVLGKGINYAPASGEVLPLHTTVDQFVPQGDIKLIDATNKFIQHRDVVYSNIEEGADHKLKFSELGETESRLAPWSRNNESYPDPADLVSQQVSTIYLDNPSTSSYAYSIQSSKQWDINKLFKVACNDNNAQAVEMPNGKIAAIFYTGESFEYKGNTYSGSPGQFKIF